MRSNSCERDRGRIRVYKYGRRAEGSKRRKGDYYSGQAPVSGGGLLRSPKEAPQESMVIGGFQELSILKFLGLLRSDDQPLDES